MIDMKRILLVLVLLACSSALDVDVLVEVPESIVVGDIMQTNITVSNNNNFPIDVYIDHHAGANPIYPEPIDDNVPGGDGDVAPAWKPPYYHWEFALSEFSQKTVFFKEQIQSIGELSVSVDAYASPATEGNYERFSSNEVHTWVYCNRNGICEEPEFYKNCPEDCESGTADGFCDGEKDGRCDPDCVTLGIPENDMDCSSGEFDGVCDGIKDGKYDRDCTFEQDPDCIGNEQWCIEQLYGATPTPEPSETIVTYSFSGGWMLIELSKPAQGELPEGAKEQIISNTEWMFELIGLPVKDINVRVAYEKLIITATAKEDVGESVTFTPVPEYIIVVEGVSSIEPTPDSLENGVATYQTAPESITVSFSAEGGFDWLLVLLVGLIVIIGAWLVKRKLR